MPLSVSRDWDRFFGEDDPSFASVRDAAARFRSFDRWPTIDELNEALCDLTPVRFERQPPKPRRKRSAVPPARTYDGRIVLEGVVSTRPGSWHDFFNALVWASFPLAKLALHRRQHHEQLARTGPRPRTRSQDLLTMLDEGGVVVRDGERWVFGHAILEHRHAGIHAVRGREVDLCAFAAPDTTTDRALARWLDAGHC